MKIIKGDKVKIITGKNKGVESTVMKANPRKNQIIVENVNIATKHVKKDRLNQGGIIKVEKPINVSNAMLMCPKCKKPSRVGYTIVDGKKYRICKKCKELLVLK
jgi:large subunit ribosomal protein L24